MSQKASAGATLHDKHAICYKLNWLSAGKKWLDLCISHRLTHHLPGKYHLPRPMFLGRVYRLVRAAATRKVARLPVLGASEDMEVGQPFVELFDSLLA